jgi:hypothetical protein
MPFVAVFICFIGSIIALSLYSVFSGNLDKAKSKSSDVYDQKEIDRLEKSKNYAFFATLGFTSVACFVLFLQIKFQI